MSLFKNLFQALSLFNVEFDFFPIQFLTSIIIKLGAYNFLESANFIHVESVQGAQQTRGQKNRIQRLPTYRKTSKYSTLKSPKNQPC